MNLRIDLPSCIMLVLTACKPQPSSENQALGRTPTDIGDEAASTASDARAFVGRAERRLEELGQHAERMAWVQANFITYDTESLLGRRQRSTDCGTSRNCVRGGKICPCDRTRR